MRADRLIYVALAAEIDLLAGANANALWRYDAYAERRMP